MNLMERAEKILPGGVSSPVRAFRGVGGTPVFVRSAQGAYLEGEDGRRYVDYIGGYGPHILGHRHPAIVAAIAEALGRGTAFGAPTLAEVEIAETIAEALPSVEMVRLVNSGTEATMSALRLARAATGRDKFVKFEGCYHGHADPFLIAAGSGAATIGVPSSPGVPAAVVADTLLAPYNDLEAAERLFERDGDAIAAIIVEPIAGNMNLVPPVPGFLEGLRALCDRHGAILIFDEVMTGFRVAWGGAQNVLDVEPDLTTLGKVIGGGLPLAAYAGRRDLMRRIAPAGPVYQAGTLSGNPLAVAAGRAALAELGKDEGCPYETLETTGARLQAGIEEAGRRHGIPVRIERQGSMLGLFFTAGPIRRMEDVTATDRPRFSRVFHHLLDRGIHLPPSAYETMFLSTAHGEAEIAATLEAFDAAFATEAARRVTHPDVLVLGGGIIGLACARELALRGLRVEVVERLPHGAEASLAAAGMLSPIGESSAPGPFLDACRASRDLWGPWVAALEAETGLSVDYDTSGCLLVALGEEDEAELERAVRTARGLDERADEVEIPALRHWVPDITPGVRRAVHLPDEHRVDNVQLCAVLAQSLQKLGVTIHYESEVLHVGRRDPEGTVLVHGHHWRKEARLLVLAAGAWSGLIPELPPLPVRPVRGQMLLLGGVEWPWSGSVRQGHFYVVRRGATGLLVGATVEEAGFDKHTTVEGIEDLLAFARRLLPGIGHVRLETVWAGLRPGTPDDLPILGALPGWPVIAATGHFRNGILLAPWTARQVARLALTEREEEIPEFSLRRFLSRS